MALLAYLIISSQPVSLEKPAENREAGDFSQALDSEEIESNYKQNAKIVFIELERVIQSVYQSRTATSGESGPTATSSGDKSAIFSMAEKISALRDRLISLNVPEGYKELHLEMVIYMDKIENSLSGDLGAQEAGDLQFLSRIKNNYPWLQS